MLVGWAGFIGLFFFGAYFTFRNSRYGDSKLFMAIPALIFGLPSAITNAIWNVFFATFVFWELPSLKDGDEFSPYFTTRIKNRLKAGKDDPMTRWFVWAVSEYDNDHFGGWRGLGPNPYV